MRQAVQRERPVSVVWRRAAAFRAFTLIELLVVIAVISILAALLLPALTRSKDSARAVQCVNNLRQLAIGSTVYAGDTGRFPSILSWLYPYPATGNDTTNITKGQLYPYVKSAELFRCPLETGTLPFTGPIDHSYQMNCMACHAKDGTSCLAPSKTVFLLEVTNQQRGAFGAMANPPNPGQLAFWHNRHEHFLMIDTHVERLSRSEYTNAVSDKRFWYPTEATDRAGNP